MGGLHVGTKQKSLRGKIARNRQLADEATVRGSHSGPHEIGTEVEMGAVAGARGPG